MTSGAGKGNFSSKFLNLIGGKKKPKQKYGSTGSVGSADSDEDGYMDPEGLCPTDPPRESPKPPVPDYPPPFCPTSRSPKAPLRPFSSIEYGNAHNNQIRDHTRSLDTGSRILKPPVAEKPKVASPRVDDYSDPWDSKTRSLNPPRGAPMKPVNNQRNKDNYMDPYDSKTTTKPPVNCTPKRDNYIEPWDSRSTQSTKPRDVKKPYRDDYKDPWDSKTPASLPKSSYEEDEDYTEPYDAGTKPKSNLVSNGVNPTAPVQEDIYDMTYEDQIVAARAQLDTGRKNSKDLVQQQKQAPKFVQESDYEEPWEYKAKNFPKPASKAPSATSQAQNMQQQDGNYDAPWEWNTKLPPAKAGRTDTSRDRVESSSNHQNRPKPNRTQLPNESIPTNNQDGERMYEVDPTIPLNNQNWYHGKISRIEAEGMLRGLPDCSYLLRDSESSKTDFSLSLRNHNEPMHLKISCRKGKFILGLNSRPYDTIPEMIHHYSMNTLNIKGAEQVKLIYPVIQEAMYFTVEPGS